MDSNKGLSSAEKAAHDENKMPDYFFNEKVANEENKISDYSSDEKVANDENKMPDCSSAEKVANDENKIPDCSSAEKVANDKNKMPEYSSRTSNHPAYQRPGLRIILERFQAYITPSSFPKYEYVPTPFFFYGTFTDPLRLQEVLQLPEPPVLKPATVEACKIMLWGQFPAIVNGPIGSLVRGMAYIVETEQHEKMLERYETDVYSAEGIRITIDGKDVAGCAFMWDGDPTVLKEGTWSLEEWTKGVQEEMASHFRPLED